MYPAYNIPDDTEEMKKCIHLPVIEKRNKMYLPDSLEGKKKSADFYINSTLVAKTALPVYKIPSTSGDIVKSYTKGANIGKIYSWVVRDGQVWWQVNYFSGKPQGWVKHEKGLFDSEIAEQTSDGKAIEVKKEQERIEDEKSIGAQLTKGVTGITEGFGSIGANFKYILLAVLVLVAVYFFLQLKKTL